MCELASAAFERRLDSGLTQPVAVAFSGGGDSLAALIATKAWADACGRSVVALHVDHHLQPSSGAWRDFAADCARRLGVGFRGLDWHGEKPATGLPAAARRARHGLTAEAARDVGARVVVFGHTADDLGEAVLMRQAGGSLGDLAEWRPSPVWPEGRGVFLLRPLLGARRASIRQELHKAGWRWIDDPANEDLRHPRVRARLQMGADALVPPPAPDDPACAALASRAAVDDWAAIRLDRDAFRAAPAASARRVLAAAMLSAGGGERPPRVDRADALANRLAGQDDFTATLAGAQIIASKDILIVRNAGESERGGLAPVMLGDHEWTVWDGRFELSSDGGGGAVCALKGRAAQLAPEDRRRLAVAPARARPALPVVAGVDGRLVCPILAGGVGVEVRGLVGARFRAACGAVSKEPRA